MKLFVCWDDTTDAIELPRLKWMNNNGNGIDEGGADGLLLFAGV